MKTCYSNLMNDHLLIVPPSGEDDTEGAVRVFEEFLTLYQPTLIRIEFYLEEVIEQAGPEYADAYRPWHTALHDLFKGVYLTAKKIPLPNKSRFIDALKTFNFESALQFLRDLCANCKIQLSEDWVARFREHINLLLFSISILNRTEQPALAR